MRSLGPASLTGHRSYATEAAAKVGRMTGGSSGSSVAAAARRQARTWLQTELNAGYNLALHGERGAFEMLVRRHQRALVGHIYRHTGQHDGALDLAQEVFLKVYLSLDTFDPKYRFTTWLYRIASNCAIAILRARPKPEAQRPSVR